MSDKTRRAVVYQNLNGSWYWQVEYATGGTVRPWGELAKSKRAFRFRFTAKRAARRALKAYSRAGEVVT